MTGRPVSRRSAVDPFLAMDVLRAATRREAAGEAVLHLELGQPGWPAPAAALAAARAALGSERLGYTEALGRASLRARIARHYGERHGIDLDPARVVVTTGSSGGFTLAFLMLFDAGEAIALAEPGYPAYRNIMRALGLEPVGLPVGPAERWQPTVDQVRDAAAAGASGLLVASPANPTGTMLSERALGELARLCEELSMVLISDEIYHGLTYDRPATTALAHSDAAIVINSFSKYHCMTGWRVGWMVVPAERERVVERLAQNLYISPPTLSQIAAEAALDAGAELDARRDVYGRNRQVLTSALAGAGLGEFAPADGAFYLYADVRRFTNDSAAFAEAMLAEIKVAATPGLDFDPARGAGYLRLSYAEDAAVIAEAAGRIAAWLR
jgi:aspartate/methionine/tyrosine aminotransferase